MEIPNDRLEKVLQEYMEEYDFGHNMDGYDAFAVVEKVVFELFSVDINELHKKAASLVANTAIERTNWGVSLFVQLTGQY